MTLWRDHERNDGQTITRTFNNYLSVFRVGKYSKNPKHLVSRNTLYSRSNFSWIHSSSYNICSRTNSQYSIRDNVSVLIENDVWLVLHDLLFYSLCHILFLFLLFFLTSLIILGNNKMAAFSILISTSTSRSDCLF